MMRGGRLGILFLLSVVSLAADDSAAGYVDAATCRSCHTSIYDEYEKTTMGRAFSLPDAAGTIADWTKNNTYYHEPSRRYYEMTERGGKFFMRRYQKDSRGREVHSLERQVTHVMGSGKRALTYIHRSPDGRMIELPVGWYSREKQWAMSPGYDKPDHAGFTRAITNRCMFCHNGYPLEELKTNRPGWDHDPRFPDLLPMGIDCQRCHGPGEAHVQEAARPESIEKVRATIVNPARLSNERQLDVCMQCHLGTPFRSPKSSRRFGRKFYSYRPGEPLGDYAVHFDYAEGTGHEDDFEIVSAAYRLRKSACFLASEGALTCTTCHDPHKSLAADQSVEHYREACIGCHNGESHFEQQDCIACHMPQRRTKDVVRIVMTDHLIQRDRPDRDLLAPMEEEPDGGQDFEAAAALYLPAELSPELREVYLGTAEVLESANREAGVKRLTEALQHADVRAPEPWFELAQALVKLGRLPEAKSNFEKVLELDPLFVQAHNNFGNALADMGQTAEAIDHLKKVIELDAKFEAPTADAYNNLGLVYVDLRKYDEAEQAFREAMRVNPLFADAHLNLGTLFFQKGRYAEAAAEFEQALAVDPGVVTARNNLGLTLAALGRLAEAVEYLEQVVRDGDEALGKAAQQALETIKSSMR
ncbi:MAG: tetratricopeptide repeat protein [Acidobacteria bacterium]|nr:tetratricopeptide repeat protein [Acidobacteriota bacterium]